MQAKSGGGVTEHSDRTVNIVLFLQTQQSFVRCFFFVQLSFALLKLNNSKVLKFRDVQSERGSQSAIAYQTGLNRAVSKQDLTRPSPPPPAAATALSELG